MLAAVIILIIAFGSVLAMGLPIGIALFGLGVSSAVVTLLSHTLSMPDFTSAMVAMIGLGVGIDYALFIVTRYREALHAGSTVDDSIAEALDTSGRAVIFAGTTVIIALLGLSLMGLGFVTGVAIAFDQGVGIGGEQLVVKVQAREELGAECRPLGRLGRRLGNRLAAPARPHPTRSLCRRHRPPED